MVTVRSAAGSSAPSIQVVPPSVLVRMVIELDPIPWIARSPAVRTWKSSCPVNATGSQVVPASVLRMSPRLCSPSSAGVFGPGCPEA